MYGQVHARHCHGPFRESVFSFTVFMRGIANYVDALLFPWGMHRNGLQVLGSGTEYQSDSSVLLTSRMSQHEASTTAISHIINFPGSKASICRAVHTFLGSI